MHYRLTGSDMDNLMILTMNEKVENYWHIKGDQGVSWKKVQMNIKPAQDMKVL